MANFNQIILIGRVTRNPEIKYTKSAEPVPIARFGLAVDRKYKESGKTVTDFFDIEAWRKKAEFAEKHLSKGQTIQVIGSMQRYEFGDPKKYGYKVVADDFYFISKKNNGSESGSDQSASTGIPDGFDPLAGDAGTPQGFDPLAEEDMFFSYRLRAYYRFYSRNIDFKCPKVL